MSWPQRQLNATRTDATIEDRIGFDENGISLIGRTSYGMTTLVWCDGGAQNARDILETADYLAERFTADEEGALRIWVDAGVPGHPREILKRAIKVWTLAGEAL